MELKARYERAKKLGTSSLQQDLQILIMNTKQTRTIKTSPVSKKMHMSLEESFKQLVRSTQILPDQTAHEDLGEGLTHHAYYNNQLSDANW